jgi:hypothetical protein
MKLLALVLATASCSAFAQHPAELIPPGSPNQNFLGMAKPVSLSSQKAAPLNDPRYTVAPTGSRTEMGAGPLVQTESVQPIEPQVRGRSSTRGWKPDDTFVNGGPN